MHIVCTDLEGCLVPEIWINVALKTGIEKLKLTTRDINDYDKLMHMRLEILEKHNLTLPQIQEVIKTLDPLPGAQDFLTWLKKKTQVVVVSDTFAQFAGPLMEKLGFPTLFCHELVVSGEGKITGYKLRQKDGKRKVVQALKSLDYTVTAMGDSYNDMTMLEEAHHGVLFKPPQNVVEDYPQYPVTQDYPELKKALTDILDS